MTLPNNQTKSQRDENSVEVKHGYLTVLPDTTDEDNGCTENSAKVQQNTQSQENKGIKIFNCLLNI